MGAQSIDDLVAFLAVARERSFTRASAKLGVSQSSLSQTVRNLEDRLGLKLLARTTRSVAPTTIGLAFMRNIEVHLEGIQREIASIEQLRDKPQGTVRISSPTFAAGSVLWPKLAPILREHPDINLEIVGNNGFVDIVSEGFDAGVRLGEHIAKDMIAVRIGPDLRMACVAAPSYFRKHPPPKVPQDLLKHNCINFRFSRTGGDYHWEFERGRRKLKLRVDGQLTFSDLEPMLEAAREGFGIANLGVDIVRQDLKKGRLQQVLAEWCQPFSGLHLYYPSRLHSSSAFSVIVEALRYKPEQESKV